VTIRNLHEDEVEGVRAPAPNSRTLKHLAAPWTLGTEHIWVGLSEIDPGSSSNRHEHAAEEVFYVVDGRGAIEVGGERTDVRRGSVVAVPSWTPHQIVNKGNTVLKVLCSASPPFTESDFDAAHRLGGADKGDGPLR
jgi:mannose-6-phosphate isomerase-like protein (cupin superfamily)